ncbi:MAG: GCN5-related N-acetyltransferase [Chthonomonadaceae bacterium]|nr:GCN5-related N-acetyltransferase [Chthonomonadaceae bacterium]
MKQVEIRRVEQDELEKALPVWSQAFEKGDRTMDEWRDMEAAYKDRSVTFGLFDSAGLQATVLVMDCKLHFGPDIRVPMGALGGVACLPASRGKGYAGDTIRFALERMKEAGHVTSVLSPFSWQFYQNLGWDWTGASRRYSVTTHVLRPHPETEFVRAAVPADRPRIIACYEAFAGRYRGMLVRQEAEWNSVLNDRKKEYAYAFLYEKDGSVEGYLAFHGWKEEETRLRDFITLTPRAQMALLGLLRRHEMQVKKFTWNAPENDLLWSQFIDWDLETRLKPLQMARIVDFPAALALLNPGLDQKGVVDVGIRDAHAPWNDGVWRIVVDIGHVEATRTRGIAQVEMDIRQATQAFFGAPTLEDLRRADRITVHDESGYGRLQRLSDGPPMWINDDF